MHTIIILGSKNSGKKTLKEKISSRLPEFRFDVYSGGILSSYTEGILVVNLEDGPMPETLDHLIAAHKANLPRILCFLNKSDLVPDKELHDLVNLECRELAERYGYSGENILIISGSALQNKDVDNLTKHLRNGINKHKDVDNWNMNPSVYETSVHNFLINLIE
jgi:translation elongation factor EF-Tu-like GTPase